MTTQSPAGDPAPPVAVDRQQDQPFDLSAWFEDYFLRTRT